jgi:hypothetical protein
MRCKILQYYFSDFLVEKSSLDDRETKLREKLVRVIQKINLQVSLGFESSHFLTTLSYIYLNIARTNICISIEILENLTSQFCKKYQEMK